ncbi:MAG: T9SS type A sorting domain-containing protein [Flavobacterium sp.]|nr:MAG: T9SS type A sorting domain-containing protein [Flavobacterium sp.]
MKKIFTLSVLFCSGIAFAQLPTLEWHGAFGGPQNDAGTSMSLAPDGSLYITGNFSGTVDFDPGTGIETRTAVGSVNTFIQKLSTTGALLWVKTLNLNTVAFTSLCKADAAGNVYIAAPFTGTADLDPGAGVANVVTSLNNNTFLLKLTPAGDYVWAKAMETVGGSPSAVYALQTDANGNIYSSGYYSGSLTQGNTTITSAGSLDSFIQKYDSNGNPLWLKSFGGSEIDLASQIVMDGSGNIYVTGIFQGTSDLDPGAAQFNVTGQGFTDAYITKLSTAGDFIWAKTLGGNNQEGFGDIKVDSNGNIYVAAYSNSITLNIATQPATAFTTNGSYDSLLLKLDSSGNPLWVRQFGGTGSDFAVRLIIDNAGKIVVTGQFTEVMNFGPLGSTTITSAGGSDIFIAMFSVDGEFEIGYSFPGGGVESIYDFFSDAAGDYYMLGRYNQSFDVDPSAATATITSNGFEDYFVAKYHPQSLGSETFKSIENFVLYPNPSNGNFTIEGNGIENAEITISNNLGKVVKQYKTGDDVTNRLSAGVYFVEVAANGKREVKKMIVK